MCLRNLLRFTRARLAFIAARCVSSRMAGAIGTSLTVIAWHEHCGERTIQNRINASLDAMRREFSGRG